MSMRNVTTEKLCQNEVRNYKREDLSNEQYSKVKIHFPNTYSPDYYHCVLLSILLTFVAGRNHL
jgi:hypothetical protein